jgi:hypothetical protein
MRDRDTSSRNTKPIATPRTRIYDRQEIKARSGGKNVSSKDTCRALEEMSGLLQSREFKSEPNVSRSEGAKKF